MSGTTRWSGFAGGLGRKTQTCIGECQFHLALFPALGRLSRESHEMQLIRLLPQRLSSSRLPARSYKISFRQHLFVSRAQGLLRMRAFPRLH
jgi:hypothetical protein